MVTVERISDVEAFGGLRKEWTDLLEESRSNCLFLTWEWLYTWWNHLSSGETLSLITVRHNGRLVALAPFAERPRRLTRAIPFRSLEFIGTGSVGSDYLDIIVRQGMEREALKSLAEYLAAGDLMLDLRQLRAGASAAASLAGPLAGHGWKARRTVTDVCPFIDLSTHSWDSYLATLSSNRRQIVRRRLRKLGDFNVDQVCADDQRPGALALLFAFHNKWWNERGGSTAFNTPALRAFHEELSGIALDRGWLRLFLLSLSGVPAAALYGFRYGATFSYYQLGFDPAFAKHRVGAAAIALAIRQALEEHAGEFDFLHGSEPYKFHWARDTRELEQLELYPAGLRGAARLHAVTLNKTARALLRSARREAKQPPAWIERRMSGRG